MQGAVVEVTASALILGYGVLVDRVLPGAAYVPANLTAAGLAVVLANRAGASIKDMGLEKSKMSDGFKVGLLTIAPIAAIVGAGVLIPWTREFFLVKNVVNANTGRTLYEMLIRIPVGTALAEELIFRGALMGVFLRKRSPLAAALLSSLVFGLWHISPTLRSCSTSPAIERAASSGFWAALGIVSAVVAATAFAGAVLAWLRLKSESIIAPLFAHAFLNTSAFLGGRVAMRIGD